MTDKIIKKYSDNLKIIESTRIEKNNDYMIDEFKNIMQFLEEKTEYLFMLKKQYNIKYKKLNKII